MAPGAPICWFQPALPLPWRPVTRYRTTLSRRAWGSGRELSAAAAWSSPRGDPSAVAQLRRPIADPIAQLAPRGSVDSWPMASIIRDTLGGMPACR
jgi:hypothetical protein